MCEASAGATRLVGGQPHSVDADHRSNSRIQAAHSAAALDGQVTVTDIALRRSSIRMSCTGAGAGMVIGTNVGFGNAGDAADIALSPATEATGVISALRSH